MEQVVWQALNEAAQQKVLQRNQLVADATLSPTVTNIIGQVRTDKDSALREFAKQFDKHELNDIVVNPSDLQAIELPDALVAAIDQAIDNIRRFHNAQTSAPIKVETQPGIVCELRSEPIESVGLYVPGGSAPLISTVLMLAVPAKIAGCKRIVLASPPPINPAILYAAKACAVSEIVQVGGAQAIAAMAYGTESVPKVDKIYGPGNRYVTEAKTQVSLDPQGASIDMPAGPSEVLVIADDQASEQFVAADLLSQAEHGEDSQAMLVCLSCAFADRVQDAVQQQLQQLPRAEIAAKALASSRIIVVEDISQAIAVSNRYAPEHLILQTESNQTVLAGIRNAGSVFVGPYSPESVGDYASGTNHVLPTYGFSKTVSSLSLADFQRRFTVQTLSKNGLMKIADSVMTLANAEGLNAHENAVAVRLKELS
ncbi:histidinol dehydrogenase [Paraferrimonas haliotis]|uniref:histidinol dehydrogenase n=1 Tax=Paraferrimonas haliotis TaxID=2013866 RepID=UPI000BA900E6|nr:histidinol dehydrogenase [Paraferrimonas haliotis]